MYRDDLLKVISAFIIALLLLLISMRAYGADKWDKVDLALGATAIISMGMDWRQTKEIASRPDLHREKNQLLGSHPSNNDVDAYFAAAAVITLAVAHFLPSSWRKVWLGSITAGEIYTIGHNSGSGISIRW
jgi:hypothetical protein